MNAKHNQKIVIVTTGHPARDERLLHKFGKSLTGAGYGVTLLTTLEDTSEEAYGVHLRGKAINRLPKREKVKRLADLITQEQPDAVIAAEPLAVYASSVSNNRGGRHSPIIYDVTEWYPEQLTSKIRSLRKFPVYAAGYMFNLVCARKADAFIFGEANKGKRYRRFAPATPHITVGYYPDTDFIKPATNSSTATAFTIGFSGILDDKRGFFRYLDLLARMQELLPAGSIAGAVTGSFADSEDEAEFRRRTAEGTMPPVTLTGRVPYEAFSAAMAAADICIDLRERDFIYANSLPIKIFDYLAMGKPVVYSDIAPIREFFGSRLPGLLVEPDAIESIASAIISRYIKSPGTLLQERKRALKLAEEYRWSRIEEEFLGFIAGVIERAERV